MFCNNFCFSVRTLNIIHIIKIYFKQFVRFFRDLRTSTFEEFYLTSGVEDSSYSNEVKDWRNREENSLWWIIGKAHQRKR